MISLKRIITRGLLSAIGASVLLTATAEPALAQGVYRKPIELKNLEKGKDTLNEEKGYIFIDSPARINAMFMKKPDAEDIEAFEEEWAEKFEKAKAKYVKRQKAYESKKKRGDRVPEKPVEPTEETFSIGQIESRLMVTIGPQYVFDKGKLASGEKYFQYLHELDPGEYTYYGPLFFDPNQGAIGGCYCMGSFKFEVKAGEITSLGDFLTQSWASNADLKKSNLFFVPDPDRVTKPTDWSVPETLSALPSAKADLQAAGKMNNFYRVAVWRSPPIEGVLRYERGTVIDVKAELAAKAAAEAEALAKAQAEAEAVALAEAKAKAEAEAAALAAKETADAEAEVEAQGAPASQD